MISLLNCYLCPQLKLLNKTRLQSYERTIVACHTTFPHGKLNTPRNKEAYDRLVSYTKHPIWARNIYGCLGRLEHLRWELSGGPGAINKTAHDIDTAFFDSRLRGNCIIRWSTTKEIAKKASKDANELLDITFRSVRGRRKIYLNTDIILEDADMGKAILEIFFHESKRFY